MNLKLTSLKLYKQFSYRPTNTKLGKLVEILSIARCQSAHFNDLPPDMKTFLIDVVVSMKSWYEPGRKSAVYKWHAHIRRG